ncbi:hypothetical protein AGMMS49546_29330 [Spirochaetia bacterium]|nr:hypothetical protein AGMMS49546_29330 [Spirochaetia bacterium]
MAENNDYPRILFEALTARADWIEKSELSKLKDELRTFQTSYSIIYNIFLKKKLINEDPYKQEAKISELEVPNSSSFSDAERVEQMSIRLANYDNQLDFLVNFYQFNVEFLNLDRIKRILGLIKFIDWVHLIPDSPSPVTQAVAEMTISAKNGLDPLSLSLIGESLTKLSRATGSVLQYLKLLSDYHRESYKSAVRTAVTFEMSAADATVGNIKKKFAAAMPGKPFYPDLIEELIKEDYTKDGSVLREKILKSLQVPNSKPKTAKAVVSFNAILIGGLQVIGSVSPTLLEIGLKIDDNEALIANRKQSLWHKIQRLIQQMMKKEPEPVVFDLQYTDPSRGTTTREKVNYGNLRSDMERKARLLGGFSSKAAAAKLEAMSEEQLTQLLDRNIRDVQNFHKTLTALDDFFKADASKEERDKVRGIKPELATMKNAIVRANQLRHEFSAQKEEEEQMKKLGLSPGV